VAPVYRPCSHEQSHIPVCVATLPELPEIPENDVSNIGSLSQPFGRQFSNRQPARVLPFSQEGIEHDFDYGKDHRTEDALTVGKNESGRKMNRSYLCCRCFPTYQYVHYLNILNQYLEYHEKLSFLRAARPKYQIPHKHQVLRSYYSNISRKQ
jgi:hypothetical protein